MPLSNKTIMKLNEVTVLVQDKKSLSEKEEGLIKDVFTKILEEGEWYDSEEIESWFENEGTWNHRPTIIRVANMAHYVQTRFQQRPRKLKMVSDDDGCGCS